MTFKILRLPIVIALSIPFAALIFVMCLYLSLFDHRIAQEMWNEVFNKMRTKIKQLKGLVDDCITSEDPNYWDRDDEV